MNTKLRIMFLALTCAALAACGGGSGGSQSSVSSVGSQSDPVSVPAPVSSTSTSPSSASTSGSDSGSTTPAAPASVLPAPVIGKWEWPPYDKGFIIYPYDVVVRYSSVPRNIDGSLDFTDASKPGSWQYTERLLRANTPLTCAPDSFVSPALPGGIPGGTLPMWCRVHRADEVVPDPTALLPMMDQMAGSPEVDARMVPLFFTTTYKQLRIEIAPPQIGEMPTGGQASFRLLCPPTHFGFNDPIVAPGRPGVTHGHVFCGNPDVDAFSTPESLSIGGSSGQGGVANTTAYWAPMAVNIKTHVPLRPVTWINYYKCDPATCDDAIWLPRGLKMIAGATAQNTNPNYPPAWHMWWTCSAFEGSAPYIRPDCPSGAEIVGTIAFPNCWDGVNLDSPDHRSHVTYAWGHPQSVNGKCPPSHPVAMMQLSENIHYILPEGVNGADLKLSCDLASSPVGGLCLHADVIANWRADVSDAIIRNIVRTHRDYHNTYIGDYDGDGRGDWLY